MKQVSPASVPVYQCTVAVCQCTVILYIGIIVTGAYFQKNWCLYLQDVGGYVYICGVLIDMIATARPWLERHSVYITQQFAWPMWFQLSKLCI